MTSLLQRLLLCALFAGFVPAEALADCSIVVNGRCLEKSMIRKLETMYGTKTKPGRYWYDHVSGLFGLEGQPPLGQLPPKLNIAGKLTPDASKGDTGVFVNGRQLTQSEVSTLQTYYGQIKQGRYWLDAHGNVGMEGLILPITNVLHYFNKKKLDDGSYYSNPLLGTRSGSSDVCSYVSTDSGSVLVCDD